MMLFYEIIPAGELWARHDTVGFDEAEARELCTTYAHGERSPRLAILQENMRHALVTLDRAEVAGRA